MKPHALFIAVVVALGSAPGLLAESILTNGTPANISNRARSGPGDDASITGFVIKDAATFVLIRAVGPGLAQFGVAGYATGTAFDLVDGKGAIVTQGISLSEYTAAQRGSIDNVFRALGAFAVPANSADSFAYLCLNPGSYSVVARPRGSDFGIILTEIYFDPAGVGSTVPKSYPTLQAAAEFMKGQFAGGKAEVVKVGQEEILVVQLFGSGLPVLYVATYRFAGDRWRLASVWGPRGWAQFYTVKEHNGDVVVIGNTTGEEWVVLDL